MWAVFVYQLRDFYAKHFLAIWYLLDLIRVKIHPVEFLAHDRKAAFLVFLLRRIFQ